MPATTYPHQVIAPGTPTNDNAAAGIVGEYVESRVASGSAISLTTNTPANVTSISLTAGDWDVQGNVDFSTTTATTTNSTAGITVTSATTPTDGTEINSSTNLTLTSAMDGITLPRKRVSIASTTPVYLVGRMVFSAGSVVAYGSMSARRVR